MILALQAHVSQSRFSPGLTFDQSRFSLVWLTFDQSPSTAVIVIFEKGKATVVYFIIEYHSLFVHIQRVFFGK